MSVITESGMQFGDYSDENVFHIEICSQYTKKLRPNGVKICEFILLRGSRLYFVEAKTSCPNEIQAENAEELSQKYIAYISEIVLKIRHSLTLYANILLGKYSSDGISPSFLNADLSDKEFVPLLIVKNADIEQIISLQEKLNSELFTEFRIWKINRILVMNEELARRKHLIL